MEESEFNRLVEKYQQGLLSGREKALLDEWFEAFKSEENFFLWDAEAKSQLKHRILSEIKREHENADPAEQSETSFFGRKQWNAVWRIAASLILMAVLIYTMRQFGHPKAVDTLEAFSSNAVNRIVLADGSIVWLKPNSALIYPEEFLGKDRTVKLEGEALFEVAKDASHPFVIHCGELITTVLGTSFNIKSSPESIEVVVLTGKVSLTSENDQQGVVLLPAEKAVYSLGEKHIAKIETATETTEENDNFTRVVTGTGYRMDFKDTRMDEVIRRIEVKFSVKVNMEDQRLGGCVITADFTDQSLERTLDMIAQALGFSYEIDEKEVTLYGSGCK